jgi:hypothetical protein
VTAVARHLHVKVFHYILLDNRHSCIAPLTLLHRIFIYVGPWQEPVVTWDVGCGLCGPNAKKKLEIKVLLEFVDFILHFS